MHQCQLVVICFMSNAELNFLISFYLRQHSSEFAESNLTGEQISSCASTECGTNLFAKLLAWSKEHEIYLLARLLILVTLFSFRLSFSLWFAVICSKDEVRVRSGANAYFAPQFRSAPGARNRTGCGNFAPERGIAPQPTSKQWECIEKSLLNVIQYG